MSCKHKAHSGTSVTPKDETDIHDRVHTRGCQGFLGFYSTIPSAGLAGKLNASTLSFEIQIYDSEKIERHLLSKPEGIELAQRLFPKSIGQWKHDHPIPAEIFSTAPELLCLYCRKSLLNAKPEWRRGCLEYRLVPSTTRNALSTYTGAVRGLVIKPCRHAIVAADSLTHGKTTGLAHSGPLFSATHLRRLACPSLPCKRSERRKVRNALRLWARSAARRREPATGASGPRGRSAQVIEPGQHTWQRFVKRFCRCAQRRYRHREG